MQEFFGHSCSCDRCQNVLKDPSESWFTSETICESCLDWESLIASTVDETLSELHDCGEIPNVEFSIDWGSDIPEDLQQTTINL